LGYEAAWLLLSFAIMVVAVLVNVHEKLERLEERLNRLEARDGAGHYAADFTEAGRGRDRA
jgi:BMFP domain-containing protein YqiC